MRFRSVLFTPGDRPERVRKAWLGGKADVVVADLEDGVAPQEKRAAREAVAALLREVPEAPCVRAVRINAWPGALAEADLAAVVAHRPDLIVVPKAADPAALASLSQAILEAEQAAGIEAGAVRLLLILESAAGVLRAHELAATPHVVAIALGAEDLAADAGMRRSASNQEVAVARGLVALAAAAAGVAAIDMITADYHDVDRTAREAREARGSGYRGKMCIHPAQVPVVHEAFVPTQAERAWAEKVVAAAEAGAVAEGGVVVVDGTMVDVPLVRQAERILQDADVAGR